MLFFYRLVILLYDLAIKLVSPVSLKARQFREGRKELFPEMEAALSQRKGKLIWIHAASLGEFEQGRPVIESLKNWDHELEILLTFFSPSGYEVRKGYELADYIHYLPLDHPTNARKFVSIAKPDLAIFIKYELWYHYLQVLQQKRIRTVIISARFRADQFYFKPYGSFFKSVLKRIDQFYVQDERSGEILKSIGISQFAVTGDTRFDRVTMIAEDAREMPLLERFKAEEFLMVAGSLWPSDMKVLKPFIYKNLKKVKLVIAPHVPERHMIQELLKLPDSVAFSAADQKNVSSFRILILDNMGMLASAYRYGDFAWVGGGYRGALHNTLEAAVFGIPVFFGKHPNNSRFAEALQLADSGGGFEMNNLDELETTFERLLSDRALYQRSCKAAESYVYSQAGATSKIMSDLKHLIAPETL